MPLNRLLVIDDEPEVAATVGRVARRAGFDTIVTTDAADFLDRALSWSPSVIVLDLAMPELDGLAILKALSRQGSKAHILIVSGHDRVEMEYARSFGRNLGLNIAALLQKPLRIEWLREALRIIYDAQEVISADDAQLAIQRDEFFLEYQPKVRLDTLQTIGVEALARWNHPTRGLISPDSFIPVMETAGVMTRFTPHVIEMVVTQARRWRAIGINLNIAINVSGGCVGRLPLDDIIGRHCAEQRVDPAMLTVEITETAAMGDVVQAVACMRRLNAMGVRISIDDFGTGYSSLVQLHRLPFSEIKIDRSFVHGCAVNSERGIIVKTIISLARSLSLEVVAEGIETEDSRHFLQTHGCQIGQGYLFSRPRVAHAIPDWMATLPARPADVATTLHP